MTRNDVLRALFFVWVVFNYSCSASPDQNEQSISDVFKLSQESVGAWQMPPSVSMDWKEDQLWLQGDEGWWTSKEPYENFICEFEINSSDKVMIGLRMPTPGQAGYLISMDTDSASLNPLGTIVDHARSTWTEALGSGEWISMKIEAVGNSITVFADEQEISFTRDDTYSKGLVGLKIKDSVGLRNFQLSPVFDTKNSEPLLENTYREDQSQTWTHFFQGQSLQGWTSSGTGTWVFENGENLKGTAGEVPDYLVSDSVFQDFYLVLDFRIEFEENSGVFIRKHPDSLISLNDAIECNIYDFNGPAHAYSTGSQVTHARSWYGMVAYDQWNTMEVFAEGPLVVVYINEKKASEHLFEDPFVKPGQIALQAGTRVFGDNGPSTVWFRNVRIKEF